MSDVFGVTNEELADFIRDQVCCPRPQGCELNGAEECPAERVRTALRAPPASPTGRQLGPGKRDELPPIVSEGVVAELVEALRPFAEIKPSSWYPEDGSEGEDYIVLLRGNYANPPAFNAADLARARSALSKATGEGG